MFSKAVGILEGNCKLNVVGVTCDGTYPKRRMHLDMTRAEDINGDLHVTYQMRNVFAKDEEEYIYMVNEAPPPPPPTFQRLHGTAC